jgi:hypothetical protein
MEMAGRVSRAKNEKGKSHINKGRAQSALPFFVHPDCLIYPLEISLF